MCRDACQEDISIVRGLLRRRVINIHGYRWDVVVPSIFTDREKSSIVAGGGLRHVKNIIETEQRVFLFSMGLIPLCDDDVSFV